MGDSKMDVIVLTQNMKGTENNHSFPHSSVTSVRTVGGCVVSVMAPRCTSRESWLPVIRALSDALWGERSLSFSASFSYCHHHDPTVGKYSLFAFPQRVRGKLMIFLLTV